MHRIGNYTAFFGAGDVFSNWHRCQFSYRGFTFTSVEQFMMLSKAKLFADERSAIAIMATNDPAQQKAIGRKVAGFDESLWNRKRESIVYVGCREKFAQNRAMRSVLMASNPTVLVEASPWDRIWGVGLDARDPGIADPSQWRGQNLLGKTLMRVRDALDPRHHF